MNFFKKLFSKPSQVQCPRCLGKGNVDMDDIRRLKRELVWDTGPCAYCLATGLVDARMPDNIPADESTLVTDLSPSDRKRLINREPAMLEWAYEFGRQRELFIEQILYLYRLTKLSTEQIADFFLIQKSDDNDTPESNADREELIDYIEKVIELRGTDNGSTV